MKTTLNVTEERVTLEKFRIANIQARAAKAIKEARIMAEEVKHEATKEIT